MAEEKARVRGVRLITLETASFNAPEFYRKLGYEITGQVEDLPKGQTWYNLMKRLKD